MNNTELKHLEQSVLLKSADLWNEYLKLPVVHPDDTKDVRFHIHAIQNILFARQSVLRKLANPLS